jgi:uncharacterized cupredoxin-like copper-binding protein
VICSLVRRFSVLLSCTILAVMPASALEPESVLGEYWKDPLFGEAAAEAEVQIELLHRLLWPQEFTVTAGHKVRLNVFNKTEELHVLALTADPGQLNLDSEFQAFISEEVFHASMKDGYVSGHHDHHVSSGDAALSLVRNLDQKPTITVAPGDNKELIIRFDDAAVVHLRCVIDGHEDLKHHSLIRVKGS